MLQSGQTTGFVHNVVCMYIYICVCVCVCVCVSKARIVGFTTEPLSNIIDWVSVPVMLVEQCH